MVRHLSISTFALLACVAQPAYAQKSYPPAINTWTGLDSTLTIDFPPGWRRLDEWMRSKLPKAPPTDVLMEMDKGDAIMGAPGVNCRMQVKYTPLPPGQTADKANKAMAARVNTPLPADPGVVKRAYLSGGAVVIETDLLSGKPQQHMMLWQALYAHGDKLYAPNITCGPNVTRTGLAANEQKDTLAMFAGIKIKPN